MNDFGLYIVMTKPHLPYDAFVRVCIDEGVPYLQLREKHLEDRHLLRIAGKMRMLTQHTATKFLIDDRPDIAHIVNADGLHLGPDDMTMKDALKVFPSDKIYGLSTHSLEEFITHVNLIIKQTKIKKADYLSFGPIFPTPTKVKPDKPLGCESLRYVTGSSPVPVVAIGGIFPANIELVLRSGARNICMVRYFAEAETEMVLSNRIRKIMKTIKEFNT